MDAVLMSDWMDTLSGGGGGGGWDRMDTLSTGG